MMPAILLLPAWSDPPFKDYISPVILFPLAGVGCLVGAYYASKLDGEQHRGAGGWCIILMLLGLVFLGCATGPLWVQSGS